MRLTLRTLLAYMDGLLDPKDSQEIGKKIEDSKFATELFHKIRDGMRRLRVGAPSLTERAANLDCNTVAEYLDNALPADRVLVAVGRRPRTEGFGLESLRLDLAGRAIRIGSPATRRGTVLLASSSAQKAMSSGWPISRSVAPPSDWAIAASRSGKLARSRTAATAASSKRPEG